MHPRIYAERMALANQRTLTALEALPLPEELKDRMKTISHKDPAIRALREREAIADILEALASDQLIPTPFEVDFEDGSYIRVEASPEGLPEPEVAEIQEEEEENLPEGFVEPVSEVEREMLIESGLKIEEALEKEAEPKGKRAKKS